eukprot:Colp12_sorted_trinity150504_noHs@6695
MEAQLKLVITEPRIKGPFPVQTYAQVIQACQSILDRFVLSRLILAQGVGKQLRSDVILPLIPHIKVFTTQLVLFFQLLAGAMLMRTPLPYLLPDAQGSTNKLFKSLQKLPKNTQGDKQIYYVYYLSNSLNMDLVVSELEWMGILIKAVFGEDNMLPKLIHSAEQDAIAQGFLPHEEH